MRIQIVLLAIACVSGIIADVPVPKDDFLGQFFSQILAFLKSHPYTPEEKEAVDDFGEAVMDQEDAMANEKRALEDVVQVTRDDAVAAEDEVQLKKDRAQDDVLAVKEEMDEFFKDTLKGKDADSSH